MTARRITIGSHEYAITTIGDRAQVEVECILGRHLGPALGSGISTILRSLAVEAVKAARAIVADPSWDLEPSEDASSFDLARLLRAWETSDSRDEYTERAWDALCKEAPVFLGDLLREAVPQLTDRLDHGQIVRLFELALIGGHGAPGCLYVQQGGTTKRIGNWDVLTRHTSADPTVKWALLLSSLLHTYRPTAEEPAADSEGE